MEPEPLRAIEFELLEFVLMLHPNRFRLPAPELAIAFATTQFAPDPLTTLTNATALAWIVIAFERYIPDRNGECDWDTITSKAQLLLPLQLAVAKFPDAGGYDRLTVAPLILSTKPYVAATAFAWVVSSEAVAEVTAVVCAA
jgi:hypothetical protein